MPSLHNRMPVFLPFHREKAMLAPDGVSFFNPFSAERTRAIGAIIVAAILGLLRVQSAVRAPYSFNLRHVTLADSGK
jgi:hypothetical protein